MMRRTLMLAPLALLAGLTGCKYWVGHRKPSPEMLQQAYGTPLPAPNGPLRVFHLGHSLVGRDMPAMLKQLAPSGHSYESQLGWGTSLREHWESDLPINGFEVENAHPRFQPVEKALDSGSYNALILTEMVEIRDAIRYHKSARYLTLWADRAYAANPNIRIYLYETWHKTDDPEGWLTRLDADLTRYWENKLLLADLRASNGARPVHVIPAGQVMAAFVRAVEERGGIDNIRDRNDLFARFEDGTIDPIHVNDLGAYLVALTHFAVLYHRPPLGLARQLMRADGTPAHAPGPEAARLMQQVVWDVVTSYNKTGVAP